MLRLTTVAVALSLLFSNVAEAGGCFRGGGFFGGRGLFRGRHHQMTGCGPSYGGYSHGYSQGACATYPAMGGCNSGGYGGCQVSYGGQQAYGAQQYYAAPQYAAPQQYTYAPQYARPMAVQGAQVVQATMVQQTTVSGDPTGFLSLLNAQRARMGLGPVSFGADCYADACQNNMYQQRMGLGHFYMGRARRQNAAMGQQSSQQVLYSWMGSPGHASALFDPSIRVAAVAFNGRDWTFSAY